MTDLTPQTPPDGGSPERIPVLIALAGALVAALSLLLAGASGAPYLTSDGVNGWVVVFAVALFATLFALPFALERGLRARVPDPERRWERAMLAWGGIAAVVLAVALAVGLSADLAGSSLAGSAGLLAAIESGLVLLTLVAWILSDRAVPAGLEVADIFRRHGDAYRRRHDGRLGRVERRVMSAIERCRTAELGGHVVRCDDCAHTVIAYNSCRNRHCPKCQGSAAPIGSPTARPRCCVE